MHTWSCVLSHRQRYSHDWSPVDTRLAVTSCAAGSRQQPSRSPLPWLPECCVVFDSWLFSAVIKSSSVCRLYSSSLLSPCLAVCPLAPLLRAGMLPQLTFLCFLSWVLGFSDTPASCFCYSSALSGQFSSLPVPVTPVPVASWPGTQFAASMVCFEGTVILGLGEAAEQKSTDSKKVRYSLSPDPAEGCVRIHGDSLCNCLPRGNH